MPPNAQGLSGGAAPFAVSVRCRTRLAALHSPLPRRIDLTLHMAFALATVNYGVALPTVPVSP